MTVIQPREKRCEVDIEDDMLAQPDHNLVPKYTYQNNSRSKLLCSLLFLSKISETFSLCFMKLKDPLKYLVLKLYIIVVENKFGQLTATFSIYLRTKLLIIVCHPNLKLSQFQAFSLRYNPLIKPRKVWMQLVLHLHIFMMQFV